MSSEEKSEPVLVSACLVGVECRYDGAANLSESLLERLSRENFIPVPFCPEERGGLSTPRPAAWIEKENAAAVLAGESRVITNTGADVTDAFLSGAREALSTCERLNIKRAYLKERSPSCGVCQTHVDNQLVDGPGVTAELLQSAGIVVEGC
ncbi:MAG: hypothetical protein ACI8TQ_001759 [Planctomycetota bacterium]|jgi:uncharacterized protein YbbK (DUF523 family)